MAKKAKPTTIMIKKAELTGFVHLESADFKFDSLGCYKCSLKLTGAEAKKAKSAIDDAMKKNMVEHEAARMAKPPYEVLKEEKALVIRCKMKAKIKLKSGEMIEKKVNLYDAKAQRIEVPIGLAAGSIVNANCTLYKWNVASTGAGVTVQPTDLQILELVSYFTNEDEAGGSIFDIEEGFEADDAPAPSGDLAGPNEKLAADGQPEPDDDDDEDDLDIDF